MKAFEIHTFRDGQWKVDSVFDDRDLAVHEARKVDEGGRYAGVRVIEENYDEVSDLTTTRTIFRGRKESAKSKAPRPTPRKASRAAGRAAGGSGVERQHNGTARARAQKKQTGVVGPLLYLFMLVVAGLLVLFGLNYVGGAM